MRQLVYALAFALLTVACGSDNAKKEERAGRVAREYYQQLIEGKYESFVCGMAGAEKADSAYRMLLIENAKMFMAQQKEEHAGGIAKVELSHTKVNDKRNAAEAYLILSYADSTKEEIVVPMVEVDDLWYMK